jgi:hypothetical protein
VPHHRKLPVITTMISREGVHTQDALDARTYTLILQCTKIKSGNTQFPCRNKTQMHSHLAMKEMTKSK